MTSGSNINMPWFQFYHSQSAYAYRRSARGRTNEDKAYKLATPMPFRSLLRNILFADSKIISLIGLVWVAHHKGLILKKMRIDSQYLAEICGLTRRRYRSIPQFSCNV